MLTQRFAYRPGIAAVAALGAIACGDDTDLDPAAPRNVAVQVSPSVPTVVSVSWATDQPSIGYVEYGTTPDMPFSTPKQPLLTQHRVNLLGLAPATSYYYRIVTWMDHNAGASARGTIQTGSFAAQIPAFTVQGSEQERLVATSLVGQSVAIIVDPQGQVVWARPDPQGLEVYRVRISGDGASVLHNSVGAFGAPVDNSALVRVPLDGSSESLVPIPKLGIDFVEHTDGTLGALAADERDSEGMLRRGDKIVEVATDGTVSDVWSTWDCFDPVTVPGDGAAPAWTSANALEFSDSEQAYYVGLRDLSSIVKVDRATRTCAWVLGGNASTFTFADGAELFSHQAQFHALTTGRPPRLLVMDNEGGGAAPRVLQYELDLDQQLATMVLNQAAPAGVLPGFGEPELLPGSVFINWSTGLMQSVGTDGQPLWQLSSEGAVFGYSSLTLSLYTGAVRRPAVMP